MMTAPASDRFFPTDSQRRQHPTTRRYRLHGLTALVLLALSSCASPPTPKQVNVKLDGKWVEVVDGSVITVRDAKGRFQPPVITAPTKDELKAARKWIR